MVTPAPRVAAPPAPTDDPAFPFYSPGGYSPEQSVGLLMRHAVQSLRTHIEREMEPLGLTNAQWVPLYRLHLGHATTGTELARRCELDAGAVTRMLDRLEAKGLVRRARSESDRRVVHLELTDEGRQAAELIPAALSKVLNAHLRGFSVEEWQLLRSFLERIIANGAALQAAGAGPESPA